MIASPGLDMCKIWTKATKVDAKAHLAHTYNVPSPMFANLHMRTQCGVVISAAAKLV